LTKCIERNEDEKKRHYNERVLSIFKKYLRVKDRDVVFLILYVFDQTNTLGDFILYPPF